MKNIEKNGNFYVKSHGKKGTQPRNHPYSAHDWKLFRRPWLDVCRGFLVGGRWFRKHAFLYIPAAAFFLVLFLFLLDKKKKRRPEFSKIHISETKDHVQKKRKHPNGLW